VSRQHQRLTQQQQPQPQQQLVSSREAVVATTDAAAAATAAASPVLTSKVDELSARSGLPGLKELPGLSNLEDVLEENTTSVERDIVSDMKDIDFRIRKCTMELRNKYDDVPARIERGLAFLDKGTQSTNGLLHFAKAVSDFTLVLEEGKTLIEPLYQRGIAYQKLGQMEKAISDFTQVLKLDPEHAHAAFARAACQNIAGRFSQAIDDYELALKNDDRAGGSLRMSRLISLASPTRDGGVPKDLFSSATTQHLPSSSSTHRVNTPKTTMATSKSILRQLIKTTKPTKAADASTAKSITTNHEFQTTSIGSRHQLPSSASGMVNSKSKIQPFHKGATSLSPSTSLPPSSSSSPPPAKALWTKPAADTVKKPQEQPDEKLTDAAYFCNVGIKASRSREYKQAIQAYDVALQIDRNHVKALFNKGYALYKLERYDEAISMYSRAISIDSTNCRAFYNRGINRDKAGDIVGAIADFTIAIRSKHQLVHKEQDSRERTERGEKKGGKANDTKSMPSNQTPTADANNLVVSFYYNRAILYMKLNELDEAISDFTMALELHPKHNRAMINRAKCMFKLGRFKDALMDYNAALSISAQRNYQISALMGRAQVYQQTNDLPKALKDTDMAMSLIANQSNNKQITAGDTIDTTTASGSSHSRNNECKTKARLQSLTALIEQNPKDYTLLHQRAVLHAKFGHPSMAIQDFTKALRAAEDAKSPLNPHFSRTQVLLDRASSYQSIDDFDSALSDLSTILRKDPSNIIALGSRGFVLAAQGRYQLALEDYKAVLISDSSNMDALFNCAVCYEKLGDVGKAMKIYDRIIEMSPENAQAYWNRGLLREHLGSSKGAKADMKYARKLGFSE